MWTSDPTPIIAQLMDLDKRGHLGNIMTIMIFVIIYVEPGLYHNRAGTQLSDCTIDSTGCFQGLEKVGRPPSFSCDWLVKE